MPPCNLSWGVQPDLPCYADIQSEQSQTSGTSVASGKIQIDGKGHTTVYHYCCVTKQFLAPHSLYDDSACLTGLPEPGIEILQAPQAVRACGGWWQQPARFARQSHKGQKVLSTMTPKLPKPVLVVYSVLCVASMFHCILKLNAAVRGSCNCVL